MQSSLSIKSLPGVHLNTRGTVIDHYAVFFLQLAFPPGLESSHSTLSILQGMFHDVNAWQRKKLPVSRFRLSDKFIGN